MTSCESSKNESRALRIYQGNPLKIMNAQNWNTEMARIRSHHRIAVGFGWIWTVTCCTGLQLPWTVEVEPQLDHEEKRNLCGWKNCTTYPHSFRSYPLARYLQRSKYESYATLSNGKGWFQYSAGRGSDLSSRDWSYYDIKFSKPKCGENPYHGTQRSKRCLKMYCRKLSCRISTDFQGAESHKWRKQWTETAKSYRFFRVHVCI